LRRAASEIAVIAGIACDRKIRKLGMIGTDYADSA